MDNSARRAYRECQNQEEGAEGGGISYIGNGIQCKRYLCRAGRRATFGKFPFDQGLRGHGRTLSLDLCLIQSTAYAAKTDQSRTFVCYSMKPIHPKLHLLLCLR